MFRVIETFSGIGSQAKALSRLGIDYEVVNIAEWDINAILAYYNIHKKGNSTDKYKDITDEEIIEHLSSMTLSTNGKEPMNEKSLKRLPMAFKRELYEAIEETQNLGSITDIKGEQVREDIDLFTYSFPCQDLSLCGCWHGNQTGISREAENRSGMLWEVERVLLEMNDLGKKLPKFLLMENVTNILSKTHMDDFNEWKSILEELGYYNKVYRLNAKNFGVPQRRERAYMISILCKNSKKAVGYLDQYFKDHDLEQLEEAARVRERDLHLKDILCLKYKSNKMYVEEANLSCPNNTPSRIKIYEDNDMLYNGKKVADVVVKTITTKQDRNPNSGLITYKNSLEGKAQWRYLTPRECFKLMGFDEEDFEKVIKNNPQITRGRKLYSTEKLIKLAGNSIVVDVLEGIFKQIIEIDDTVMKKYNRKRTI